MRIDVRPFVILALVFFLARVALAADCDCRKACQYASALELTRGQLCTAAEARRCGGEINLSLVSLKREAANPWAEKFKSALTELKPVMMELYKNEIGEDDYTQIAALSFALLGAESDYYQSWRYFLKSWTPAPAIDVIQCLVRGQCGPGYPNSEGPTQMKQIPERVAKRLGVTARTLYRNPGHAAAATLGFVIEMRQAMFDLKRTKYPVALRNLTDRTFPDHLAYFYQGKGRRILRDLEIPDPDKNPYLALLNHHLASTQLRQLDCRAPAPTTAQESEKILR